MPQAPSGLYEDLTRGYANVSATRYFCYQHYSYCCCYFQLLLLIPPCYYYTSVNNVAIINLCDYYLEVSLAVCLICLCL
jgi:hypothetical protein